MLFRSGRRATRIICKSHHLQNVARAGPHALDQRLCERLLRRDDVAYFGLIGSQTKRRKFEHRFRARGIAPERIARIVCPIGEPGIEGKQPAVIAVAVAAQLLRLRSGRERRAAAPARAETPVHTEETP